MKKMMLALPVLALVLWTPAWAQDDLGKRVERLEKLMKRLEEKIDHLGKTEEKEEGVKVEVEKRVIVVPGDEEFEVPAEGRSFFYFARPEGEEKEDDVILPRFRLRVHEEVPDVKPFPGVRVLKIEKDDPGEIEVEIVVDGKTYRGTLRHAEGEKAEEDKAEKEEKKEGEKKETFFRWIEGPVDPEHMKEARERFERALERAGTPADEAPRLFELRVEEGRKEAERARKDRDPLQEEIDRVQKLLDRLLERKKERSREE